MLPIFRIASSDNPGRGIATIDALRVAEIAGKLSDLPRAHLRSCSSAWRAEVLRRGGPGPGGTGSQPAATPTANHFKSMVGKRCRSETRPNKRTPPLNWQDSATTRGTR